MEMIFLQTPYCCQACKKKVNEGVTVKKCSSCKCAHYCNDICQRVDWTKHKTYCKMLLYVKESKVPAFTQAKRSANKEMSETYQAALRSAQGPAVLQNVKLTATAAESFVKYCFEDILPSCELEEQVWGLRGDPRSPGYQRLLTVYQKALKYTDLNAQKLMECLLARPHASRALTQALHSVKFVQIKGDSYDMSKDMIDRYLALTAGLEVDSEFDRWPIGPGGPPAAV